jgi:hypothetical protein
MIVADTTITTTTLLTSAVVSAIVAGIVALATFALGGRRERKDRQRQVFADAYAATAAYREFPFMIRRRNANDDAGERVRLSNALSEVQQQLVQHQAVLRVEAPGVARSYTELVRKTRQVAGSYISDAWKRPPPADDTGVSIQDIDLSALDEFDDVYLREVADHIAQLPAWIHRVGRCFASKLHLRRQ